MSRSHLWTNAHLSVRNLSIQNDFILFIRLDSLFPERKGNSTFWPQSATHSSSFSNISTSLPKYLVEREDARSNLQLLLLPRLYLGYHPKCSSLFETSHYLMVLIRRTAFNFWINRELQETTLSLTLTFALVKDRTNQNKIDKWNFDNRLKKKTWGRNICHNKISQQFSWYVAYYVLVTLNLSAKHSDNHFIFLVFIELGEHKEACLKIVSSWFLLT